MNEQKKVIYIAGPITGVEKYYEAFERAEDDLQAIGYLPLSPARLPMGMTNAQYIRICLAMLDSADAIVLLPGWANSEGATLEKDYARYAKIPRVTLRTKSPLGGHALTTKERRAWLEIELMEAFAWAPHITPLEEVGD